MLRCLQGQEGCLWLARAVFKISPKLKFSVSGKKNVGLFGVMTKTSVSSDKNVPLTIPKNANLKVSNSITNFKL